MNTTKTLRVAVKSALALTASLALWGCCGSADSSAVGPSFGVQIASWDFESQCAINDPTCGFRVEAGRASRSGTFHTGEHGMSLGATTTISQNILENAYTSYPGAPMFPPTVNLLLRCDPGTSLAVSITSVSSESYRPGAARVPATQTGEALTGEAWHPASVTFDRAPSSDVVTGLRISTTGPGGCQIDKLRIVRGGFGGGGYCG